MSPPARGLRHSLPFRTLHGRVVRGIDSYPQAWLAIKGISVSQPALRVTWVPSVSSGSGQGPSPGCLGFSEPQAGVLAWGSLQGTLVEREN